MRREDQLRWLMRKGCLEIGIPWMTPLPERASLVLEMATRDRDLRWNWMHVPGNGDWYALTASFFDAKVDLGGGWTKAQASELTGRLKGHVSWAEPLPPAPFAYAGYEALA